MVVDLPDVDLDVKDREKVAGYFPTAVVCSQIVRKRLVPHNTGLHFQKVPLDPDNEIAAFPYDMAEELGYYKIDLLPNHVYDRVESMKHLDELLNAPVDWSWFEQPDFVKTLFHFGGIVVAGRSVADVVASYRPQSISDLAHLVAIKLPAKKYLIGQSWQKIRAEMWVKDVEKRPQFKKSHAVAYALVIVLDAQLRKRDTES